MPALTAASTLVAKSPVSTLTRSLLTLMPSCFAHVLQRGVQRLLGGLEVLVAGDHVEGLALELVGRRRRDGAGGAGGGDGAAARGGGAVAAALPLGRSVLRRRHSLLPAGVRRCRRASSLRPLPLPPGRWSLPLPWSARAPVVGAAGFGVSVAVLPPQAARMAAAALAAMPPRKPRRESRENRVCPSSIIFPHNPYN